MFEIKAPGVLRNQAEQKNKAAARLREMARRQRLLADDMEAEAAWYELSAGRMISIAELGEASSSQ